ncbi:putative reverse transcriptase domain-containing protein, partial [Tanacetum coccineum]
MTSRPRHVFRPGPVWGCDRLLIRAKVIENQVVILGDFYFCGCQETSTSDSCLFHLRSCGVTDDSLVTSPTGLCGLVPYSDSASDSPDEMSLPEHISSLPAISPFLCTDSSKAPYSSDGPPSQDTLFTARPGIRETAIEFCWRKAIPFGRPYRTHLKGPHKLLTARKRVGPLPARRLASRRISPRSSDHHPSSSSSSSDSSPSSLSFGGHFVIGVPALHYSYLVSRSSESSSGDSSERPLHSSSHSARPSRKRCRSPVDSVPSSTPVIGSLAPTRAVIEEDIEIDPIKTEVDMELGIGDGDDVRDHVKIDPRDVRDDTEEYEANTSAGDTVEVGIDPMSAPIVEEEIVEPAGEDSFGTRDGIIRRLEADQLIDRGREVSMIVRIDSLRLENKVLLRAMLDIVTLDRFFVNSLVFNGLFTGEFHQVGNGNGTGNGNNRGDNGDGNENCNVNGRGERPVAHECTYQDFMKCQPLSFKGTKGVVGLIRWSEKMKTVFHISNYPERYQVIELLRLMTEVYCPRNEIQKMETELWNLSVKYNDMDTYTQRLQDVVRIANNLMDQKLKGYDVRNAKNKRRLNKNYRNNCGQQPPYKRQNTRGQNVARAYMAGNNEKNGYEGTLPFCNRVVIATTTHGNPGPNQRVITCFECGAQGHYRKDCPKVKNQNRRNKARVPDARGKAYVPGGGDANPGSNTIT